MVGDHYYLIEFCYFGNAMMYAFIFFFPESKAMYYGCYVLGSGAIGWALSLVGCKFVLHNVDFLTSVFIHMTPLTTMWNVHWKTSYNEELSWNLYDAKNDTFGVDFLLNYYGYAILFYVIWASAFYLVTFVIAKKRMEKRGYHNLYKMFMTKGKGFEYNFINKYGEKYTVPMYFVMHFLSFLVTSTIALPGFFFFSYSCVMMVYLCGSSFWNGATYYMDYFSKKYEVNLMKLDEIEKHINDELTQQIKSE
jgi:hypothetical protein